MSILDFFKKDRNHKKNKEREWTEIDSEKSKKYRYEGCRFIGEIGKNNEKCLMKIEATESKNIHPSIGLNIGETEGSPTLPSKPDGVISTIKTTTLAEYVDVKPNISETLVQTWGKLPNSQGTITSTFEEFYEICIKNRLDNLENTIKIMEGYISQLLLDIEKLQCKEKKIDDEIKLHDTDTIYSTPLSKLYGKDYIYNTTSAILDVLKNSKKELHVKDIFSKIQCYNLKNPNVSYDTVKSIVYILVKKKKIRHGFHNGCFEILSSRRGKSIKKMPVSLKNK